VWVAHASEYTENVLDTTKLDTKKLDTKKLDTKILHHTSVDTTNMTRTDSLAYHLYHNLSDIQKTLPWPDSVYASAVPIGLQDQDIDTQRMFLREQWFTKQYWALFNTWKYIMQHNLPENYLALTNHNGDVLLDTASGRRFFDFLCDMLPEGNKHVTFDAFVALVTANESRHTNVAMHSINHTWYPYRQTDGSYSRIDIHHSQKIVKSLNTYFYKKFDVDYNLSYSDWDEFFSDMSTFQTWENIAQSDQKNTDAEVFAINFLRIINHTFAAWYTNGKRSALRDFLALYTSTDPKQQKKARKIRADLLDIFWGNCDDHKDHGIEYQDSVAK